MLVPKLFTTLKSYTRSQFTDDLVAGIIVGIVALPLAIAFAIASGVSPDRGLYRMRSHYSSSRCSRASGRP